MSARQPWDPSLGPSRPAPEPPKAPKPRCAPTNPRGLTYLSNELQKPNASRKLNAFVRFREYVERRQRRHSRVTAVDRAIAAELAAGDAHSVIERRSYLDFTAATWSTIYALALASNTSPKTIIEALVSLGLEQTAFGIRSDGVAPAVAC